MLLRVGSVLLLLVAWCSIHIEQRTASSIQRRTEQHVEPIESNESLCSAASSRRSELVYLSTFETTGHATLLLLLLLTMIVLCCYCSCHCHGLVCARCDVSCDSILPLQLVSCPPLATTAVDGLDC